MSDISTDVLVERIDNFKEYMKNSVEVGFAGIHRRFDENDKEHKVMVKGIEHTNGTVCEHSEEITNIKSDHAETLAYLKGMLKTLTWVAFITPCIVGALFTLYIQNFRNDISKEIDAKIKISIEDFANKNFDEYNK